MAILMRGFGHTDNFIELRGYQIEVKDLNLKQIMWVFYAHNSQVEPVRFSGSTFGKKLWRVALRCEPRFLAGV
jgi:hypothetical protein